MAQAESWSKACCCSQAAINGYMKNRACLLLALLVCAANLRQATGATVRPGERHLLNSNWQLQSSVLAQEDGATISSPAYRPRQWLPTAVPATVLHALVRNGVYPDPRFGLDGF